MTTQGFIGQVKKTHAKKMENKRTRLLELGPLLSAHNDIVLNN